MSFHESAQVSVNGNQNVISSSSNNSEERNEGMVYENIKVQVRKFSKGDSIQWLFKANEFFDYHHVAIEERLHLALFALQDEAYDQYQRMKSTT